MAAVARRTRRRAQISSHCQSLVVDARRILRKLVRGDFVSLHVVGVRVAIRARFRDVHRVNRRLRIVRRVNIVHRVAIRANRHARVSLGQEFSMHARLILAELVGAQ